MLFRGPLIEEYHVVVRGTVIEEVLRLEELWLSRAPESQKSPGGQIGRDFYGRLLWTGMFGFF